MQLDSNPKSKVSNELLEKLTSVGISKSFKEGDVILDEDSYIKSIPIVTKGSIKVLRSDDDGR